MPFAIAIDLTCRAGESGSDAREVQSSAQDKDTSSSSPTSSCKAEAISPSSPSLSCTCASSLSECACRSSSVDAVKRSAFVTSAERIRLTHDKRQTLNDDDASSSLVGIFVPFFVVDPILEQAKGGGDGHVTVTESSSCPQHVECKCVQWLGPKIDDILPQIHSSLAGLIVKGIISTRNATDTGTSPVAMVLVLIEVPRSKGMDAVTALIDKIQGHAMDKAYNAIIKVLPLSRISFTAAEQTTEHSNQQSSVDLELPSCPVCLHRIDPQRLGWPRPKTRELCSQFCSAVGTADGEADACDNMRFLTPWPDPSCCRACRVIWEQWKSSSDIASATAAAAAAEKDTVCYKCGMKETLWVCLTCGVVGCGRYSQAHAKQHNDDTGHPYSLELVTQRIWDYSAGDGEFVQRGDLLDCSAMRLRLGKGHAIIPPMPVGSPLNRSLSAPLRKDAEGFPQIEDLNFDSPNESFISEVGSSYGRGSSFRHPDPSPKKATMVGEEYEALLQSALEDQAQHYEGEITRLIATLTAQRVDNEKLSDDEAAEVEKLRRDITSLRSEAERLGKDLIESQSEEASLRASSQKLLREQAVSKSLLEKIKDEAKAEHDEGQAQVEELEQQVADLTANIRMREQIEASEELSNAQIFGTTSVPPKSGGRSGKKGKKGRRSGRR